MAVISRIRKHSGWLVALIGISIAGFILQDAFSGGGRGGKAPKFAVVDGQEIKLEQFEQKVDDMSEQFRRAQGDVTLSNEDVNEIRNRVWMTMLNDILLTKSCKQLGLSVSQKELNDMYYGRFIHNQVYRIFADPNTGVINRQQVMMTINNFDQLPAESQKALRDLEVFVKDDRLKSKYYNLLAQGFYVPKFYANFLYAQTNSSASCVMASMDYMDIADDQVTLTDADYKKYFEENKSLFKRETSRAVDFVVFDVQPTVQDLEDIEKHVGELYVEFQVEPNMQDFVNAVSSQRYDSTYHKREELSAPWDSILFKAAPGQVFAPIVRRNRYEMAKLIDVQSRPDSLRASHILISFQGSNASQGSTRSKDQAKALADSLRLEILKNKSRFVEFVTAFSEDGSKENAGDLGWFLDGQMVGTFNEAVVKGNVGDVVVVETVFGYHVIEVTGKTPPQRKVRAAFVYVPIEPSAQTNKEIFTVANQFFGQCTDHATMLKLAEEKKMPLRKAEYLEEMAMQVPGISNARDLVRWAYNKKTKAGDVSKEIFEYENRYVIASLRSIREEGYPSLAELKEIPEVQYAVRNQMKAKRLVEEATKKLASKNIQDLAAMKAQIDTVDQVIFSAYGLGNKSYEPEVIGTLFGMKNASVSKPIVGKSGVFVLQKTAFVPAQALDNMSMIQQQLQMMFQQQLVDNVRVAMEKAAEIKDNRSFYF